MRVFVTGASGFVGSAVVAELLRAGHKVLGLVRTETAAETLRGTGAEVLLGSLEDLEGLRKGAAAADAVIHTAFIHDFSKWVENCEKDRAAIEAIGGVLAGSGKSFLVTSGLAGLVAGRPANESDSGENAVFASPRMPSEALTLALAEKGVKAALVRLPPSVHDENDHGFVPMLIKIAREKGVSAYVGEGQNRWSAVHRLDAALLYRLALEKGEAGMRYHAVGDQGVTFKEIATAIGKGLNLPVVSKTPEEAAAHFGFLGHFTGADLQATGKVTEEKLGFRATHKGLIADLNEGNYFRS